MSEIYKKITGIIESFFKIPSSDKDDLKTISIYNVDGKAHFKDKDGSNFIEFKSLNFPPSNPGQVPFMGSSVFTKEEDYKEVTGTSWTMIDRFAWPAGFAPSWWFVLASQSKSGVTAYYRLYDETNFNEIAQVSKNTTDLEIITTYTISNIPTINSIVSVQAKASTASDQIRLHHLIMG